MVISQYENCFGCIPLRQGLMGWGYIKVLIPTVTFIVVLCSTIDTGPKWFTVLLMTSMVIDAIFNAVLVAGCHLKNTKLLQVAYGYSAFAFFALVILACILFGFIVNLLPNCAGCLATVFVLTGALIITILDILLQYYLWLLIRSWILSLSHEMKLSAIYQEKDREGHDSNTSEKLTVDI